ncbi:unnamed protein product [Cladocopium goreaui]|uniref:Voltage-dependent T-type calcium channel subunit alpha-1H n=1 Tax=Cladocopium goreaui TaxID=2562237 RepID=A0A9P1CGP1_9DINO|nr:unnamed protein product [Cladocopium goreaui]
MLPNELLGNLGAVKLQLQSSSDGILQLSHQHREWQRSVESMLHSIEQQVFHISVESMAVSEVEVTVAETPQDLHHTSHGILGPNIGDDGGKSLPSFSLSPKKFFSTQLERRERYKKAKHLHSKKISALHPLLQSRKAVQQCPAGPLRKLLSEMLQSEDQDAPAMLSVTNRVRSFSASIAGSTWFEYGSGLVIFLNLIAIGFEAELSLEAGDYDTGFWFHGLERLFLCIYCAEALFRAFSFGWQILWDLWFLIDLALIFVGILALVVIPMSASKMTGFEKLLLVRGLRLLRLMRVLRMVHHFKIIWRLVSGFLTAWDTIFASAALILVTLFIFACIAIEFIAKDGELIRSPITQPVVEEYFMGVGRSMLTLIQFVTLDELRSFYYPLILERPWLSVYFFSILLVVSMGLLNLVTACLVENAMDNAAVTAEEERSTLKQKVRGNEYYYNISRTLYALPSLIDIFQELDSDGSGLLTHQEVDNVPLEILPPRVLDSVYVDSMRDIFDLLDVNECGFLTQMEFVEGILNLCLLDMPVATMQNLKLLKIIHDQLLRIEHSVSKNDDPVIDFQEAGFGV